MNVRPVLKTSENELCYMKLLITEERLNFVVEVDMLPSLCNGGQI